MNYSIEGISILSGCLSLIAMIFLLLTFTIFPSIRRQKFIQILKYLCLSWLMASLGLCLGYPPNESVLCKTQAFLLLYFTPASGAWMAWIFHAFYCQSFYGGHMMDIKYMHVLSWLSPCWVAFLPLCRLSYGRQDSVFVFNSNSGPCVYSSSSLREYFDWFIVMTIIYIILYTIFYSIVGISIVLKFGLSFAPIRAVLIMAVAELITWLPFFVLGIMILLNAVPASTTTRDAMLLVYAWTFQCGPLVTIIFLRNSVESRNAWKMLWIKGTLGDSLLGETAGKSGYANTSSISVGIGMSNVTDESVASMDSTL